MRPAGKARRPRIPAVFEGGAARPVGRRPQGSFVELLIVLASVLAFARPCHAQAPAAPTDETTGGPVVTAGPDGFTLKSADNNFRVNLKGMVQSDGRFFVKQEVVKPQDTFILRRVRPIFEATVYDKFDFRIMPDFGQGTVVVFDAYVEARFAPFLRVRSGKFKGPVGLERLQTGYLMPFVERAMPSFLVPNRDVGVMVSGDVAKNRVTYAAGVFNGVVDYGEHGADVSDHGGKEFAGRVFVRPFAANAKAKNDLGIGFVVTRGQVLGTPATPNRLPTGPRGSSRSSASCRTAAPAPPLPTAATSASRCRGTSTDRGSGCSPSRCSRR